MSREKNFKKYLDLLFNQIPANKQNDLTKEIIKQTIIGDNSNQQQTQLHHLLLQKLNQEGMDGLKQQLLGVDKDYKLDSVIAQLYKNKPQSDDINILGQLQKEESYFQGKWLEVNDPKGNESIFNEIISCRRYQENNDSFLQFTLKNDSQVELKYKPDQIQEVYTSYVKKMKLVELFKYIQSKDQLLKGTIQFKQQKEENVDQRLKIKPGIYYLKCNEYKTNKDTQIELEEYSLNSVNSQNNTPSYKFQLDYKGGGIFGGIFGGYFSKNDGKVKKIVFIDNTNSKQSNNEINQYQLQPLICNYREEKKLLQSLNSQNAIENIYIKEMQVDEYKEKLKQLDEISICKDNILKFFIDQNNSEILKQLLDDLVLNNFKLKQVNVDSKTFTENMNRIQQLILSLNIKESKESILQNAVIEAIYTNLIQKSKTLYILKEMDLLNDSFHRIKSIKNMDLILFLGGTGSGKSTSINYYLGHKLEEFEDYNRKFIKLNDGRKFQKLSDEENFATIGQSLAISETTFIQAFKVDGKENLMLCDCPGFYDTRGEVFDMINTFSIDQTIKNCNSIKAIVLTLPEDAFFQNKCRGVLDLFESLQTFIPDIFKENAVKNSIYLLITKYKNQNEVEGNLIKAINTILEEDNNLLESLEQNNQCQDNYLQIQIRERLKIWNFVQQLIHSKRIKSYDITDKLEGKDQITEMSQSPSIDKIYFCNAMNQQNIQTTLSNFILHQIDTWQVQIFEKYLTEIPNQIKQVENQILEKQPYIEQKEQQNKEWEEQIQHKQTEIADKDNQIIKLQQLFQNNDSDTFEMELKQYTKDSDNILKDAQDKLEKIKSDLNKNQQKQMEIQNYIIVFNKEIIAIQDQMEKLTQEIYELSHGNTNRILYSQQLGPDDELEGFNLSTKQQIKAFNNVTELKYDGQGTTLKAKDYTGTMSHHILIDKEYCIVPKGINNENCKVFYDQQIYSDGFKYKANIEGYNWKFQHGMKAHENRKKMVYSIITTWSAGNPLPWFTISHDLPNKEINEATIINKYAQIDAQKNTIKKKQEEISELKKENENIKQIIKLKEEELIINKKKIEVINRQKDITKINDQIIQFEQYIKDTKTQIEQLRKLIDITKDGIIPEQQTINKKKTELLILKQQQLHFAIIINYKKDISHLLMELIKISIDVFGMDNQIIDSNFVPRIKSYSEYYDKNMKKIESLCEQTFANYRAQYQMLQS